MIVFVDGIPHRVDSMSAVRNDAGTGGFVPTGKRVLPGQQDGFRIVTSPSLPEWSGVRCVSWVEPRTMTTGEHADMATVFLAVRWVDGVMLSSLAEFDWSRLPFDDVSMSGPIHMVRWMLQ